MHKNAQKVEQKTQTKLPATTPGCSMVKIARLDDAFLEVFEPQVSPLEGQLLQQKEKKRKIGPQCVHVWLTKLSCFDREGHKLKDMVCY